MRCWAWPSSQVPEGPGLAKRARTDEEAGFRPQLEPSARREPRSFPQQADSSECWGHGIVDYELLL
jgi:hypothetical protein